MEQPTEIERDEELNPALEGSLLAPQITTDVIALHDELTKSGHYLGLGTTSLPREEVFFRAGRHEVIGFEAIRRYFQVDGDSSGNSA